MSMNRESCVEMLLKVIPGSATIWQAHKERWSGADAGLCNDVATFSHHIADTLASNPAYSAAPGIFIVVEQLMVDGNEEVQTAIATCFLENIVNRSLSESGKYISLESLFLLLGPESKNYCECWINS